MFIERKIPKTIESGNKFTAWSIKGNPAIARFRYTNYRNKWYDAMRLFPMERTVKEWRRVEIVRVMKKGARPFDDCNLRQGCKPIHDALKKRGYLYDDSPAWMECSYSQIKLVEAKNYDPKIEPCTIIRVWK